MRTIHKFPLFRIGQVNEVEIARDAIPRRVAMQGGVLCMWAEVETDTPKKTRRFRVAGTGHPITEHDVYIGTCDDGPDGPFVWHVFEVI